ncbi:MAG: YicC family protein [Deltaproteobacteria bacterium]|nr:YicC family protein [Deltaproteobacteria bacterium]
MQSMTGFGKGELSIGGSLLSLEIKSVNHRFLDTRFRLPPALSFLELPLLEILKTYFERGSFEINVRQKSLASSETSSSVKYTVDEEAARSIIEGAEKLHLKFGTSKTPSLELLFQSGRVFVLTENSDLLPSLIEGLKTSFRTVLQDVRTMRETEGSKLKTILNQGVLELLQGVEQLKKLAPRQPEKIKEKLDSRLAQWKIGTPMDPHRMEWEIAIAAEKADITEEIDRLTTHANSFLTILNEKGPIGRKLDFLTQELHREVNTTAAKSADIEITQVAVTLKTQIEKLREQVQNVE